MVLMLLNYIHKYSHNTLDCTHRWIRYMAKTKMKQMLQQSSDTLLIVNTHILT